MNDLFAYIKLLCLYYRPGF